MKNLLLAPSARDLTGEQRQLLRSLETEFGAPFTAWMGNADSEFTRVHGDDRGIDADIRMLFASVCDSESPLTFNANAEQTYLIVPIVTGGGNSAIAVAEVSERSSDLLRRHTEQFLELERLRRSHRQVNDINDSLTHVVAGCYEELTCLRDLSVHLSLRTSPVEIAHVLLPQLRSALRVQAAAMITNFCAADEARDTHLGTTEPEVVWADKVLLEDRRCLKLISEFVGDRECELAIENDFPRHPLAADFPEVREFLVVRVGGAGEGRWLFVANRIFDERARRNHHRASEKELGTSEATLLTAVASFLATHFENVVLLRQKEELFLEVVRALVNALEARDPYTLGHSERVALYAKRLAQQIGLDEERCELIHLSGLLHDVGKVGVDDSILKKKGKLTDAEFLAIIRHPELGRDILDDLSHLKNVLPGVLYHHERYDGQGYPNQLTGEAIPLEGRLLAICDAYDAMTSDRPYRKGMPQERAESLLHEGAGTQWDSSLIAAFFEAMPDIRKIRTRYHRKAAQELLATSQANLVDAGSGTIIPDTPAMQS